MIEYRKKTPYYTYKNTNPFGSVNKHWNRGDCVIRALSVASGRSWLEAYDILAENARKTFNVPNDKKNYDEVFKKLGYAYHGLKPEEGKRRMTLEQFCKKNNKGCFIVKVANHLTAVVDGICYDTWNPAKKCVTCYYEVL